MLIRALFDRFGRADRIDCRTKGLGGFFQSGLVTEVWIVLLLYGGGVMTDLRLLDRRGVGRIFGWVRVPHPTTFGRWLRNSGETMVPLMDSTVVARYGRKLGGGGPGLQPREARSSVASIRLCLVRETGTAWACAGGRTARTPPKAWRSGSSSWWDG